MNAEFHYQEAGRVLEQAKNKDLPTDAIRAVAAIAQVHATLALAAAIEGEEL